MLIGFLWVALLTSITFLGGRVAANDKDNIKDHVCIRKDIVIGDRDVRLALEKKIDRMDDKLDRILNIVLEEKNKK